MERSHKMPLWVFLAFASISTRKSALILIWSCIAFTIYCIPWALIFKNQEWVIKIFLIDDWSWVAMMIPIIIWYFASLKWIDNNAIWVNTNKE